MGSSAGFILAFLGSFEPAAKIAVTRPGYTAYLNTLYGMGYRPVEIPVSAADGWHLTPAAIEAAFAREKFAGLLLASPANPTGAAVTRQQLADIVSTCAMGSTIADPPSARSNSPATRSSSTASASITA
jgi:aspartate/methionine/tyrosine aminotransferase